MKEVKGVPGLCGQDGVRKGSEVTCLIMDFIYILSAPFFQLMI